ncbi:hypothetical protein EJ04DRAFT_310130 [Polyplosphaeria fusca]|uniref:Uncharacterized protein n=1 Tax=Polyplosphaeria fusca TaxID=682080 RepID=A0A9P4R9T8_9PLEO|nr:hypothetical protein EJ04DRAFT_310130 [Polyplosphaeria fusca]
MVRTDAGLELFACLRGSLSASKVIASSQTLQMSPVPRYCTVLYCTILPQGAHKQAPSPLPGCLLPMFPHAHPCSSMALYDPPCTSPAVNASLASKALCRVICFRLCLPSNPSLPPFASHRIV